MQIIVHRGTHQVGGTCIEVATPNTRIILDVGEELPPLGEPSSHQMTVLPKVPGLFKKAKDVDALFISHYHGDHVGLISYVHLAVPIYISAKAVAIINKIARFTGKAELTRPTTGLMSGIPIQVGDIAVTPYLVDHSAFEAYAFVIQKEGKTVVYSGDFRAHGRKDKATRFFINQIPRQVDALLLEGTMMTRGDESVQTEAELEKKAMDFMRRKRGPVFVLQSTTNIDRVVGMYKAAKQSRRLFIMDIFAAHIASVLGVSIPRPGAFPDVRVFYPRSLTRRMFDERGEGEMMKEFSRYFISRQELRNRSDYCMLIRDSLTSDLQNLGNPVESGLILSLWSGYLGASKTKRLVEYFETKHAEVIHLHTSGHADRNCLREVVNSCSPRLLIPVHTEQPRLFLEEFNHVVLLNDGEVIEI